MRVGELITKQGQLLLENKRQASLFAAIASLVPFACWLSVAIIAFITLRKGAKAGFEVMLPTLVIHTVPLMMLMPLEGALINTLIAYIPCYLAALVLRQWASWQMVFGALFFLGSLVTILLWAFAPDFASSQLNQLNKLLGQYQEYQDLIGTQSDSFNSGLMAQLFLGLQLTGVVFSTSLTLMCARALQAKIFLPGGFGKEIQAFRSGRIAFVVLMTMISGSYYQIPICINLLPIVLVYFLLSGFNLAFFILAQKRQAKVGTLLVLLILLKPSLVLFAYILLGSIDSLVNFRVYLPKRVREST